MFRQSLFEMRLPNEERAIADRRSLPEYCLNPHPDGEARRVSSRLSAFFQPDAGVKAEHLMILHHQPHHRAA